MSAQVINFEAFNQARELFKREDFQNSVSILAGMGNFDSSLIKEELFERSGNKKYLEQLIDTRSEELLGVFDCPYHPYLLLEYTKIKDVFPTIEIDFKFDNIRCVKQIESSVGIDNEQVVAIFPENFRSVVATEAYPVFYFVNKFAQRHIKYTRPLISKVRFKSLFQSLLSLDENKIGELIANWVNTHEASHRVGVMPIPQYLNEKSSSYTAAIEELRADLNTISRCLSKKPDEHSDEYLTAIYVLVERLLAYPLFRDKKNFDAISSVFMWKYLMNENVFEGEVTVQKVKLSIDNMIQFISNIESEAVAKETVELRKSTLRSQILEFLGNYEEEFNKYNKFWGQE
jgi:hypothetical protein